MSIWVLYTEIHSEPFFRGYVTSKKRALEWILETLNDYTKSKKKIKELNDSGNTLRISIDELHIIAINLERIQ